MTKSAQRTKHYRLPKGRVLLLRTCDAEMRARGGFTWPIQGRVVAPDWRPEPTCGGGLHGLLWGAGDGSQLNWSEDARWLVVEVDPSTIVDLEGKVKTPSGLVVLVGDRQSAVDLIARHAPAGTAIVGITATAGYRGTASAGEGGTASAGDYGTASAGYRGTASAGDYGTASAGYRGTASVGYRGTASAGDYGTASAGEGGTASAGDYGTASAGYRGTASVGEGGTISIRWWDGDSSRYRIASADVGQNETCKPAVAYVVRNGKLVPKDEAGS